ncbi:hypothetical protein LOZ52_003504 [Ophidiomyces ophidiicola]|nr:hypothetical protein LOZ45_000713 [Ophidiomyces ophidiicola]KAI2158445.1 hypothetical protein LOZ26_003314 [Ophidiomyces ophidiicola]KAI2338964.1 hypothetical protein LOY96_001048 [Ophidiomyces ophidiicola]KAI2358725.1 hypothetical protein LOY95_002076 [Ophidiomyces ophidiicola]KAI2401102.1 hypothetical protein LOZ67_002534 [Ophidiomyces ophidiicola]
MAATRAQKESGWRLQKPCDVVVEVRKGRRILDEINNFLTFLPSPPPKNIVSAREARQQRELDAFIPFYHIFFASILHLSSYIHIKFYTRKAVLWPLNMNSCLVKRLPAAFKQSIFNLQSSASPSIFRPFSSSTRAYNTDRPPQQPSELGKLSEDTKANTLKTSMAAIQNITHALANPYGTTPPHHLHVYAHKHNTHLTLTRPNRSPLMSISCGSIGFKKSHRSGYDAAHQLSSYMMAKIQERGFLMDIKHLEIVLRGFGPGREAFTKLVLGNEGQKLREKIIRVTDATRLKFGGTRSPKVLLVPVTESLVNARDRDSDTPYVDLIHAEEFLGSHVLRVSTSVSAKDALAGARDFRGKARQMTTANGRTVVIRESMVFSNKGVATSKTEYASFLTGTLGFKNLNQAQLLSDILYYATGTESQPWLIYYISKPLLGTYDPGGIAQAIVPGTLIHAPEDLNAIGRSNSMPNFVRKELQSFSELLANFPMIAKQMQSGLERLLREFGKELGKPLPPPPSLLSPSIENESCGPDETASIRSIASSTQRTLPFNSAEYFESDEDLIRRALETAVTSAIDLFRLVDRQQLSLLGATTNLTGPMVERLIESYITEQVHDSLLFPRVRGFRKLEDADLDARIRQMEHIDVSQVGIAIDGGRQGKEELIHRLGRGVEEFRRIAHAKCPQDMLKILLATIKVITIEYRPDTNSESISEKQQPSVLTINADVLVSLLLVVIVRSQVRHLQALLSYMQHFIYTDDVESGESGYALSTFEAVLTYLRNDSGGLRKASAKNRRLWSATKAGNVPEMKAILEPGSQDSTSISENNHDIGGQEDLAASNGLVEKAAQDSLDPCASTNGIILPIVTQEPIDISEIPETPRLAHVFPFQTWQQNSPPKKKPRKRVSMDVGSLSESSNFSFISRSTTFGSVASCVEGDISAEILTKTQDPTGDSIPMMAVEASQPESLKYLLNLEEYYPMESILEDINSDGTTLLSAAVQLAHTEIVDIMLDYISRIQEHDILVSYLAKADSRGRTVGHYLFSVPSLIRQIGTALPWRQRDKHGQTPLFALCRSYDHPDYKLMVNEALSIAQEAQRDNLPLRLDDHVDMKGNTLLHIVSDAQILHRILHETDCDPNAINDKRFTPLMVSSKYGRIDLVRILFADARVDPHLREARGLTAVELAKDDEVRNRIDDLILFSNPQPSHLDPSGRITTVVRSVFAEDASIRFIIKSGAPNPTSPSGDEQPKKMLTYTVTTCRRSLTDFENLVNSLKTEHPASYIPDVPLFRSPLQIYSKPSRAVLHEIQERLDMLLKVLLAHPTFSTHELLWEFFLMPEVQTDMIHERSQRKVAALKERIADDYQPVTADDIRDIEQIVGHAQEAVRAVNAGTRSIIRRGHKLHNTSTDLADAISMCAYAMSSLQPPTNILPQLHIDAMNRFAASYASSSHDSTPLTQFLASLTSSHTTTAAMLDSLSRPGTLISSLNSSTRSLARSHSSLASNSLPRKFNFPGLEESRQRSMREQEQKIKELNLEVEQMGREIAWNKDVVVGELAGWTDWRGKVGKAAIREFVKTTLVREKERAKRMERCLRGLRGQ